MARKKPDLTPHSKVPYGPPRPSKLQLATWILIAVGALALIGFFVFAALTFEGGGDDAAIGALPA